MCCWCLQVVLLLQLRLMADIALVGLPNVGKSSLISALTAARAQVGAAVAACCVPCRCSAPACTSPIVVAEGSAASQVPSCGMVSHSMLACVCAHKITSICVPCLCC